MNDTALIERFKTVRARSESLCAPLEVEDYCIQAMPDVSPPKVASGACHLVLRDVHPGAVRQTVPHAAR